MKRRTDSGFSLIEMLVSLGILAMVSIMILSGVGAGRRVWDGLDARAAEGEGVSAAQSVLRDRLEHVFPATRFDADAPYTEFTGEGRTMEFLGAADAAHAPDALRRYTLSLTGGGDLTLASASELAADPYHPVVRSDVLLRGVQDVEVAYFGDAAPDGSPRWRERWEMQPAPPELIRVRVTFAAGDRRVWPELVIHPAANVDAQCVLSATTGRCGGRA